MFGLIIPPVSDCFMPTLGAAQIIGYLKSNDISCKMFDINNELNQNVLNGRFHVPEKYNILLEKNASFHKLVSTYNLLSMLYDCKISTDDFDCGVNWKNISSLNQYINDDKSLIYKLLNDISSLKEISVYPLVGFSISYSSQVIPSLILANILKKNNPTIKILLGGSFFYNYCQEFFNAFYALDIIDYTIIGRGESVIKNIIMYGNKYIESHGEYETTCVGSRLYISTIDTKDEAIVYDPNFDDIDFKIYPTSAKAFPYMIRSSCYYGKCKFCNGDKLACNDIRKDIYKSFSNIISISKKINIDNVYIVDAALSPADFIKISKMSNIGTLKWIANARFDKPLADEELMQRLFSNGCKMIRFGLESGSQHVLNLMNKGTDVNIAEKILKYTYDAGIQNHLYIMLGYPGETVHDRNETLQFLYKNRKYITSYSISFFQPIPNTPIYDELKLSITRTCGDEYSDMIDFIYKDSEYYRTIVDCAEQIKSILEEYSQTNGEYYSANIFSGYEKYDKSLVLHSEYIFDKENDLIFENEISIDVKVSEAMEVYWIYDLYNNLKINMTTPAWIREAISMDCSYNGEELYGYFADKYGIEHASIICSLFSILNKVSNFIENYRFVNNSPLHKSISVKTIKGHSLSNMSVQFSPDTIIAEE